MSPSDGGEVLSAGGTTSVVSWCEPCGSWHKSTQTPSARPSTHGQLDVSSSKDTAVQCLMFCFCLLFNHLITRRKVRKQVERGSEKLLHLDVAQEKCAQPWKAWGVCAAFGAVSGA